MKSDEAQPPKRGRPRDPERMKRVLDAAREQFHALGFERTSMESVARASGVSKMTIYSYFPSKEALFEVVIGERTDRVIGLADEAPLDPADPRAALMRVGREFLKLMRSDDVLGKHRALYAAAGHHEKACQAFYRQGPQKLIEQLAAYLRAAHEAGSLRVAKPELAADQFLSLFLGKAHIRALLELGKPTAKYDAELLRENVELFLRGYGTGSREA